MQYDYTVCVRRVFNDAVTVIEMIFRNVAYTALKKINMYCMQDKS